MERESFEDEEVASYLNKAFVAIKVDREERPDIDHIYMSVCQVLTGSGGWPLTLILTPDKKPIYAGTYFPKTDRMGMPGLITLLNKISKAWSEKRDALIETGNRIAAAVRNSGETKDEDAEDEEDLKAFVNQDTIKIKGTYSEALQNMIDSAFTHFEESFDETYGGFGAAPKFPTPHNLYFLLRYWKVKKDPIALDMVEKTLDAMHRGGIFDHIGFGFSRYSTDQKWLVPHFEKMLYDNALLSIAYLEAYQATKKSVYQDTATQVFTYILRDMASPEGGFYSAEDADSEGVEGKFYAWTPSEIRKVLGNEDGIKFCSYYDITDKGNFEGRNIPNIIKKDSPANEKETDELKSAMEKIEACRQKLFEYREKRVHPYKDDKILTAWNGLMIAALSMGGRILGDKKYLDAAEKAVKFIYAQLFSKNRSHTTNHANAQLPEESRRLLARYRDGDASILAYVDDYAFLIWGLIELYEATYKPDYLQKALALNEDLLRLFWDDKKGGLFIYGSDGEQLIDRPKDIYDGATPSGNSVSALNLIRLARLTGKQELEERAIRLINAFNRQFSSYPAGYPFSLMALMFLISPAREVVIAGGQNSEEAKILLDIVNEDYRPFMTTIYFNDDQNKQEELKALLPYLADYASVNGAAAAYVCQNATCSYPVVEPDQLRALL